MVMDKLDYWNFFQKVRPIVKFNYYLKVLHINQGAFSRFMVKQDFWSLSTTSCEMLYDLILDDFKHILSDEGLIEL